MSAIKRHIPNTITCCNLFSGCIAVTMAFQGLFGWAMTFIVLGAVFDFFDGMVARLLGVSSPIGVQIDSLADDITFGFAPSAMLFAFMQQLQYPSFLQPIADYIPYSAFLIAVFSALRLAKFNVDERQTTTFIGLPTPANALFWASLITGLGSWITEGINAGWAFIIALILISSYLLISEIPMFSLKLKSFAWNENKLRYSFLLISVPLLFMGVSAAVAIITLYVILSVITTLKK